MLCETCGFDASLWVGTDVETILLAAPLLARDHGVPHLADEVDREGDVQEVHRLLHQLHQVGRAAHAGTQTQTGTVEQISASGGGVPKLPVEHAVIGPRGLESDAQADRRNHGRPTQAVCLWSAEVIEALQAEGHPIGFGSAGENLTVRGLDWTQVTPGVRLEVGHALLQVTGYAIPCAKNAQWFVDGQFSLMSQQKRPGASRVYASVMRPGLVRPGDAVVLEPRNADLMVGQVSGEPVEQR